MPKLTLRTKLIAGYSVVTCFTLVAAAIGIWQTRKLADGLYEVGVVRLPSIQALETIFEAKTALDASKRELMRGWIDARPGPQATSAGNPPFPVIGNDTDHVDTEPDLSPDEAARLYPTDVRGLWNAVLTEETRRQERAWGRAAKAWSVYESQPKTPEEQEQWQAFTVSWTDWRESYRTVMAALERARDTGDPIALAEAQEENRKRLYTLARESRVMLTNLLELSGRIASDAKQTSIASQADAETVRRLMVVAAAASVLGAIGVGIFLSRRICRAIEPMAAAFDRIAGGDLTTRVPVTSGDEIGHMATAMNKMIRSLETSEAARVRGSDLLADTAERLKLALQTSRLGLWRRNIVTDEAEWDDRMFGIFGLSPSSRAPSRETVLSLVAPENRPGVMARWSFIPPPGETVHFRFQIVRPDGVRRHLEAHGIIHAIAGRPSEWTLGVVADVTEIMDTAAESARLRERLSQAQKMETLGGLAAGVAHDFNNLLTSIGGFIDLAATTLPVRHESVELLAEARRGASSAQDLVSRILSYARDSRQTHRTEIDLERVVQQAVPLIEAALPANIEVTLDAFPNLPLVMADSGQVQQVLMNLCTNAADAIGPDGGRIRIDIRHQTVETERAGQPACRPGNYVCLSVTDNGSGMDEATLNRIFEPYFTTKGPNEGTGLGLPNVSAIVTAHSGGLTVESRPGRGTTMSVFFPIVRTPQSDGTAGALPR